MGLFIIGNNKEILRVIFLQAEGVCEAPGKLT
jgi:hypothetical protein